MLVGKSVAYGDEDDLHYGRILRAYANTVTLSEYIAVDEKSAHYADLTRAMKDEQTRVDNLMVQVEKLSASLQRGTSGDAGNVEAMILEWAQRRLEKVEFQHLKQLCSLSKPSEPTFTILSAAAALVEAATTTPTWAATRRIISSADFLTDTQKAGKTELSTDAYNFILDTFLSNPHFNSLNNETAGHGTLTDVLLLKKWVTAVMDYQRSRFGMNDRMEIQQQIDACQLSLTASQRRLQSVQKLIQLVQGGLFLCLDSAIRLTKSTGAIRFVVPDSALHENGKFLDTGECTKICGCDTSTKQTVSVVSNLVESPEREEMIRSSRTTAASELVGILNNLAAEHNHVFDELNTIQAERNCLLDTAQYLLVCIDDQREEIVQLSQALSTSKQNELISKSLVHLWRHSCRLGHCPHAPEPRVASTRCSQKVPEMLRLATSTGEFLRGLRAAHPI